MALTSVENSGLLQALEWQLEKCRKSYADIEQTLLKTCWTHAGNRQKAVEIIKWQERELKIMEKELEDLKNG